MSEQWYYGKNGQQFGPVAREVLFQLAATGQLLPNDLVWRDGMASWAPAHSVGVPFAPAPQAYAPPPAPRPAHSGDGYGLAEDEPPAPRARASEVEYYEQAAEEDLVRRRRRGRSHSSSNLISILVGTGIVVALVVIVIVLVIALKPGNPRSFSLRAGEERSFDITFKEGVKAEIWVTSDHNTDVDIHVLDSTGQMVTMDERIDKDCYVTFTPRKTQTYTIKVRNINVGAALPVGDNYCTMKWVPKE
jgi:hypothetical protein